MAKEVTLNVTEAQDLLPFLLEQFPNKGRNKVKTMLTRGQVMVEGRIVTRHDHRLEPRQQVKILGTVRGMGEVLHGIRILFEDEHLIVIDKPPGLLSMATDEEHDRTAYRILMNHVRAASKTARVFIVHRLDRETSGVMMFAKSEAVQQALQNSWRESVLSRAYIVVVEGKVAKPEGKIETWLKESSTKTMFVSRPGDGVKAVTHYRVQRSTAEYSLLEVHLETGRKNQIRVHMQSIGHPVVGDKRYGATKNPIGRLGLHAQLLSFRHPVTEEVLTFETAIPPSFRKLFTTPAK
ncbi:RluA family pseudouridine synthase [Alicyclobacillus fastidiosus]|uniref:Pseudouridine synthase n=1 Tax=Alicyclobacillus fastidiosus TaxID=392011 RepID=A0ABY6ZHL7_9BACL|nr:RluA family pseudouridine synthase [Alicyclobacillus fastidiosus]WAH41721.1 RluA family pseudouridine synthase [Alicyclobacillus fastidiosus]GMA63404.1 pseudouridine synthase [Alicyclobacillus fastidiosus]